VFSRPKESLRGVSSSTRILLHDGVGKRVWMLGGMRVDEDDGWFEQSWARLGRREAPSC
jgi:hypothetical protein